jgi:uncharacterized SAM-dependent methyltransferase
MLKQYSLDTAAFERQLQIVEYVSALRQKYLPLKFAYIARAAHTHDELVRSREYGLADAEAALLRAEFSSSILPRLNGTQINLVDVGSGNGIKAVLVIDELHKKFEEIRYLGLDYSGELLEIAVRNILDAAPWLTVYTAQVDLEQKPFTQELSRFYAEKNYFGLLLLLGHTLGNPKDRQIALSNVARSMRSRDHLLVGIELYRPDRVTEVLAHYMNEPFYRAVFNPLTFIGLQRDDGLLQVSFNETSKNVEVNFLLQNTINVDLPSSETLRFVEGDSLLIFLSHRFELNEIEDLFLKTGFAKPLAFVDQDSGYCLVHSVLAV